MSKNVRNRQTIDIPEYKAHIMVDVSNDKNKERTRKIQRRIEISKAEKRSCTAVIPSSQLSGKLSQREMQQQ
jgi:hypothetical protein